MRSWIVVVLGLMAIYILDITERTQEGFSDKNTDDIQAHMSDVPEPPPMKPAPPATYHEGLPPTAPEHLLVRGSMGNDIDPAFNSTQEPRIAPAPPKGPYVTPFPKKRPAPYGYVYLSDQYWRLPQSHAQEYIHNPSAPLYAGPTTGMPLNAFEYTKGVGSILPDFSFKTL